jgi:hypothetical protein
MNAYYLDPASAMVFWLAGPSYFSPGGNGLTLQDGAVKKPYGFSANALNPFDPPFGRSTSTTTVATMTSRLPILYDFDESRLQAHYYYSGDPGGAGWTLSYYPRGTQKRTVEPLIYAPYLYFRAEGGNYWMPGTTATTANAPHGSPKYWPMITGSISAVGGLTESTGVTSGTATYRARPYFYYDRAKHASASQGSYFNATTFQIVSAGLDGAYGGAATANNGAAVGTSDATSSAPPRFPAADNVLGLHYDNITNFTVSKGTIEDAFPP